MLWSKCAALTQISYGRGPVFQHPTMSMNSAGSPCRRTLVFVFWRVFSSLLISLRRVPLKKRTRYCSEELQHNQCNMDYRAKDKQYTIINSYIPHPEPSIRPPYDSSTSFRRRSTRVSHQSSNRFAKPVLYRLYVTILLPSTSSSGQLETS